MLHDICGNIEADYSSGINIAVNTLENCYMSKRTNKLFIISAIVLIPLLFALPPIKIVQKLVSMCPCGNCKTATNSTPRICNVVTSQNHADDINVAVLPSLHSVLQSIVFSSGEIVDNEVRIVSDYFSESPPLRC